MSAVTKDRAQCLDDLEQQASLIVGEMVTGVISILAAANKDRT